MTKQSAKRRTHENTDVTCARIDKETLARVRKLALKERRTFGAQVSVLLEEALAARQ